ncbi:helix-turn-helix domain-containing protein [Paenibacillus sp. VCA1]|uniref:winged helix-turn-helix transcriptional regulator n=1 Tax=Paenibacillus sp. VCA1 TaxID=3039148 RepID=UPI0028714BEF|nr:helix-turn-helix domain-containing protein [Paenibacillus sp. VCA1]MDR9855107.1 helix-turn-helix domain-containing protein [Paenibacillus sp. VCA1]
MENMKAAEPAFSVTSCTARRVLEIVSNKWPVLIIFVLEKGSKPYGQLQRSIADISQKMLIQTLRQLERDGLVERSVLPEVPPVAEYALTPLGASLIPYLRQLNHWLNEHYPQIEQARKDYDAKERFREDKSTRTV